MQTFAAPQWIKPTDVCDPLLIFPVLPWGWHYRFLMKWLNNYLDRLPGHLVRWFMVPRSWILMVVDFSSNSSRPKMFTNTLIYIYTCSSLGSLKYNKSKHQLVNIIRMTIQFAQSTAVQYGCLAMHQLTMLCWTHPSQSANWIINNRKWGHDLGLPPFLLLLLIVVVRNVNFNKGIFYGLLQQNKVK